MEIRLIQEQEATLSQLTAAEARSADELVQEAITRFSVEKQADLMSDAEHDAVLAEFRTSLWTRPMHRSIGVKASVSPRRKTGSASSATSSPVPVSV
jgi:hypothetical protein